MGIQTAPQSAADAYAVPSGGAGAPEIIRPVTPAEDHAPSLPLYRNYGKRALDIVGAAAALIVLSPLILLLSILIRRDGGSSYYGHERVGRNGRLFKCWKLRSMCADSDDLLAAYLDANPVAAAEWHRDRKLAHDPRITRLGRFIRKYSLDELPQFWNVLRGDMSLVGPRPVCADELMRYAAASQAYLSVRPGVTGLWQVSGRNAVSYARRVALDVEYCARINLLLDLRICLSTVRVIVLGDGR